MSSLTRDGTAEPVSRDQILRREHGPQGNINFPCSGDHEQDWQPYPVDSYSSHMCDQTYTHTALSGVRIDSYSRVSCHQLCINYNIILLTISQVHVKI